MLWLPHPWQTSKQLKVSKNALIDCSLVWGLWIHQQQVIEERLSLGTLRFLWSFKKTTTVHYFPVIHPSLFMFLHMSIGSGAKVPITNSWVNIIGFHLGSKDCQPLSIYEALVVHEGPLTFKTSQGLPLMGSKRAVDAYCNPWDPSQTLEGFTGEHRWAAL